MRDNGTIVKENSFIVTTFIDECTEIALRQHVQHNCDTLKDRPNQETILVEITKPEIMFL